MSESKPKRVKKKYLNREFIRVSTAARLMASFYKKNDRTLKGSSVIGCGRWKAYGYDSDRAEIEFTDSGPRLHGHFKCNSAWTCAHCAKARVSKTRSWIRAALIPAMEEEGFYGSMITLTAAHTYNGCWSESISKLHDAYKIFDKNMSKEYQKIGCIGKLKALETPVGRNGIHGHFHILLVHEYGPGVDMGQFEKTARAAWERALAKVGGECNEHGFDLKLDATKDYVAKQDTAHELSSQDTKAARSKGLTLGQLLDKAALGDAKAAAEWLRAVEALQGRSRFHAGNLAKKLGIPNCSDWEDEDEDEDEEDEDEEQKPDECNENAPLPVRVSYPIGDHLKATAPDHPRPGLALILRAARQELERPGSVHSMVAALCAEYEKYRLVSAETPEEMMAAVMLAQMDGDLDFGFL